MTDLQRFEQNARSNGVLIDTNLLVLLVVGSVNRDRIAQFKRTTDYKPADWDLLTGIVEQIPHRYSIPHILSEVNTLTDMKGSERETARAILQRIIALLDELPLASVDACDTPYFLRLGLTDAALGLAAKRTGCSVLTNDRDLYLALYEDGTPVVKFDHLRAML